jgi:hypothetical protein
MIKSDYNKRFMKNNGLTKINFIIPFELKSVFKSKLSLENKEMSKVLLKFIMRYVSSKDKVKFRERLEIKE